MLAVAVDWTQVMIVGVPAYIAAIGAAIASIIGNHNRRSLRVPSGGTIGAKMELTHDLSAVNAAGIATVAQPSLQTAIEHINGADDSPVKVNETPQAQAPPQG